jgi:hypothetical protein
MGTDKTTKRPESLEKELIHALRFSGLDKENLNELVRIVVGLNDEGLDQFRVFPKGQPPVVDGLQVQALVDAEELATVLNQILTNTPRAARSVSLPLRHPQPGDFPDQRGLGRDGANGRRHGSRHRCLKLNRGCYERGLPQ